MPLNIDEKTLLPDIIKTYRGTDDKNEKKKIFNKLVSYNFNIDLAKKNYWNTQRVQFINEDVQKLYNIVRSKTPKNRLIDNDEMTSIFNTYLIQIVFEKAKIDDFTYEQFFDWAIKRLTGAIIEYIKDNVDIRNEVLEKKALENEEEDSEETVSLIEHIQFSKWKEVEGSSEFEKFYEFTNGCKNILTDKQYIIFEMRFEQKRKQNEIALELGDSEQSISKHIKNIEDRVYRHYRKYIMLKSTQNTNTYDKIKYFTELHKNFKGNNHEWFYMLLSFLETNFKKGEQDISYEQLLKNKRTLHMTVFDVLVDDNYKIRKQSFKPLYDYLELGIEINLSNKRKENIVKQCMNIFYRYIGEVEQSFFDLSKLFKYKVHRNGKTVDL